MALLLQSGTPTATAVLFHDNVSLPKRGLLLMENTHWGVGVGVGGC